MLILPLFRCTLGFELKPWDKQSCQARYRLSWAPICNASLVFFLRVWLKQWQSPYKLFPGTALTTLWGKWKPTFGVEEPQLELWLLPKPMKLLGTICRLSFLGMSLGEELPTKYSPFFFPICLFWIYKRNLSLALEKNKLKRKKQNIMLLWIDAKWNPILKWWKKKKSVFGNFAFCFCCRGKESRSRAWKWEVINEEEKEKWEVYINFLKVFFLF